MDILLQIIGVISVIESLVCSIIILINGTHASQAVVLLILGIGLIRFGRKLYNSNKKK